MTAGNNRNNSKKHVAAVLVAFAMTALVGIGMFALGLNAFFSKDQTVQAATEPLVVDFESATKEDLQALITEYQTRETQYLNELTQAASQLDQANAKVSNYESLLAQLQQAGVIQIDRNGVVTVVSRAPQSSTHFENGEFWENDD